VNVLHAVSLSLEVMPDMTMADMASSGLKFAIRVARLSERLTLVSTGLSQHAMARMSQLNKVGRHPV
jgi:hypothetical protein